MLDLLLQRFAMSTVEALAAEEPQDCAVCFEVLTEACPVRKLSCGHAFHHGCIAQWLLRRAACPLCQSEEEAPEGEKQPFLMDMGHQEVAQFVSELEDIFRAIHAGVSAWEVEKRVVLGRRRLCCGDLRPGLQPVRHPRLRG